MKRRTVSFLLAALMICAMLPMSASAAETGKLATVEFTPSDTLNDDYVTVSAKILSNGSNPLFLMIGQDTMTVSAQNGALVQEVYLSLYDPSNPGVKTMQAGSGRVRFACFWFGEARDYDDSSGTPSSDISATAGQVTKENGIYAVTRINAESVTIRSEKTDASMFSAVVVVYSIPLTKQEIIDAINEKGAAFKAEREPYKAAVSTFAEAEKAFEQPKKAFEAYEREKTEWETTDSAYQELKVRLETAQPELQRAKDAYPAARDEYLALRTLAQTLELTEAQGLPAEIKEDEALADLFTPPEPSALPVPMTTTERSFDVSNLGTETEGITITGDKSGSDIKLSHSRSITITASAGEIKSVYMVKSPSGGNITDSCVNIAASSGDFINNNRSRGAHYAVFNVNSDYLEMKLDHTTGGTMLISLPLSAIIVNYTRPMTGDEVIAALGEKGPAYEAAQNAVLLALQAVNEAQKAVDEAAALRGAAEAKWNEAQTKWETEKPAYEAAKPIFDAAEEVFRQAEEKYFAVRDDYQGFYAAGKVDLAALNREADLAEDDGLPALITEEELDTASTLSEGSLWIVFAVAVLAVGGVAALIVVKKKKTALANGAGTEDTE